MESASIDLIIFAHRLGGKKLRTFHREAEWRKSANIGENASSRGLQAWKVDRSAPWALTERQVEVWLGV